MKNECGLRCVRLDNVGVIKGSKQLIQDVSLELRCGKITAIIGANGAGKTTLLRAVLGDIKYTGEIDFTDHNSNTVSGIKIGYVPQKLNFDLSSPITVIDLFCSLKSKSPVFIFKKKQNVQVIKEKLAANGCSGLENRRLGELSGGELQRVMLALALNPIPDLLILDEPVSGVDAKGLGTFYKTVSELRKRYHMAIVLVSHDLPLVAKYADSVVLMGGKPLAIGTPAEVYNTEAFRQTFGSSFGGELL
ncbi:MAG: metal ABC transporter ATP-binding protein [Oscillospiraceae bacterium]|nr:metal ABC transporter ATP-binding protein [Oscillospiraceae bacterium]